MFLCTRYLGRCERYHPALDPNGAQRFESWSGDRC